ncbi:MAG: exodeoxyribonuclease VII large subunit [Thermodesulfovibrionales bacterium]|nr:exodeoxyribonuclease VII large subunit [Thermodesulfovibrionales bacterium]
MADLNNNFGPLTLSELTSIIKEILTSTLSANYWIIAEIGELKINQKGHCFIELVEKREEKTVAQIKANIWAYDFRRLSAKFLRETGEFLKEGIKTLFLVSVNFHEVYGLSLNIKDIETTYAIGEMSKMKRQIMARLQSEGIIDLNKTIPLPLVPQRIAVVSSPSAAGYGDFIDHLENNPYRYKFRLELFPAFMQGEEAGLTIRKALEEIKKRSNHFDLVVLIRGGGSQIDLSCFDSYELASAIARFPLPVVTGIGHERDDTICDMVANTKVKTPTAAAELIISGMRSFEERILLYQRNLNKSTENFLKDEKYRLERISKRLQHSILKIVLTNRNKVTLYSHKLKSSLETFISYQKRRLLDNNKNLVIKTNNLLVYHFRRLTNLEQAVKYLDPINTLKRGYSITYLKGKPKPLIDPHSIKVDDRIVTKLFSGSIESIVQQIERE